MAKKKTVPESALENLPFCSVVEAGRKFKTGKPVSLKYWRNTEKSPYYGSRFGQDIEPAGKYLSHDTHPSDDKIPHIERGKIYFKKPLVLQLTTDKGGEIYGKSGWKATLAREFGKKGKALSCSLKSLGFDAIITCAENDRGEQYTGEIVSLEDVKCPAPRGRRKRTP